MDREKESIILIQKLLGQSNRTQIFETDAQLFHPDSLDFLFTTDEYSCEDLFREDDPGVLGWNLVAATLSDIYAAGGIPGYFGHSMTIPPEWDDHFLARFCEGIRDCLESSAVNFIGGDTGFSSHWKYTGIAFGKVDSPLTRRGARAGDIICMTGETGAGNLEAALKVMGSHKQLKTLLDDCVIRFPLRTAEARIIRKYATSCIDSSDGLMNAVNHIAQINELGFSLSNLKYIEKGKQVCEILGFPQTILFIGECGEYELVFTVPEAFAGDMFKEAETGGLSFRHIGKLTEKKEYMLDDGGSQFNLGGFDIHARNYNDINQYISMLGEFLGKAGKKE